MIRGVLKAVQVVVSDLPRPTGPRATSASGPAAEPGESPARVHLREGRDGIEAIEVDCPCGRHLEFPCLSGDGAPDGAGA